MMQARVRAGASWNDACILNLSTRGMLMRASEAPGRGSYLEIWRGSHIVVARVVWSNADRFGVQTQDPVPAADLIRGTSGTIAAPGFGKVGPAQRRASIQPQASTSDASRWRARAMEFGTFALLAGAAAVLLIDAIREFVSEPLTAVEKALVN